MMNKGIIFDLDGTLWDSSKQVVEAWNQALARITDINYQITTEDMQAVMGKQMDEIATILFPDVSKERRTELLNACFAEEETYLTQHGGILYPHLEEVLQLLIQRGYQLFIVSNCQDGYIESFYTYHKLEKYFKDYEDPGRTGLSKGDNIKLIIERNGLDRAIYVGDTKGDYLSTCENGIPFVHASYGFGKVEEAIYSIASIQMLPALADELLK